MRNGACLEKSRRQDGHRVFLPKILSKFQGSDAGGLLDLEIICGTEMATESFEVMTISHQRQFLVLPLA